MFTCTSSTGETRSFATHAEAHLFVMLEGDASRLWSLERAPRKRLVLTVNGRTPAQLYRSAGAILGKPKCKA